MVVVSLLQVTPVLFLLLLLLRSSPPPDLYLCFCLYGLGIFYDMAMELVSPL